MKFIVMEIQTAKDGTVGNIVTAYDTRAEAEGKFHTIMAAAATSDIPAHVALVIQSDGLVIKADGYVRGEE